MFSNHHSHNRTAKGWTVLVLVLVASLLLSGCGAAQTPKTYRVGVLSGLAPFASMVDGFKARMAELGYVEGKNITYDIQQTSDPAGEQRAAKKFVADNVDLIFVFPTEASLTVKDAIQGTKIPEVFASAVIEDSTLVNSVREPGGNVTGARFPGPELMVKRFEILRELVPQIKRLGVIYNTNYPANKSSLEALRPAVAAAGVTLVEVPVTSMAEIQADLQTRAQAADVGIDAILISTDDLTQSPDGWKMVSQFAAEHNLPIAGSAAYEADSGAVFSYIPDNIETGKLAAPLADKILKGIQPGTIPVVTPEAFLRLNYKRAQELGLTVPEGLLRRANEIIR